MSERAEQVEDAADLKLYERVLVENQKFLGVRKFVMQDETLAPTVALQQRRTCKGSQ